MYISGLKAPENKVISGPLAVNKSMRIEKNTNSNPAESLYPGQFKLESSKALNFLAKNKLNISGSCNMKQKMDKTGINFFGISENVTSKLPQDKQISMLKKLNELYGAEKAPLILENIAKLMQKHKPDLSQSLTKPEWFSENDVMLITYADQIKTPGEMPLQTLNKFLKERIGNIISGVHILPFYPYSSDDGFSVIDYNEVNPDFGNWQDVKEISKDYKIMFDGVINHISAKSEWFKEYLKGNPEYKDFFIEADPKEDYSSVTRPRALPLLTKFDTTEGPKHIWTTFSDDQIDLNYKNDKVMLKIVDQLLDYVDNKAGLIRLDAIGYLWKEQGTSCINQPQTHKMIQLFRDILDVVAPDTKLVTETNVPHKDNIGYFGDGHNEAHMVYAFSLPPLTLNAFHTGDAKHLLQWVNTLEPTSNETTFFNFLASHDGIGVQPAKGILGEGEIKALCDKVKQHGGNVSYKNNGDGTKSPYELNINYMEALSNPHDSQEIKLKRFMAANAILLSLRGVPGIYVHSLLGSKNFHKGVEETGKFRSINREKLDKETLEKELDNPESLRHQVFNNLGKLITERKAEKAFSPNASQQVLYLNNHVFSLLRADEESGSKVICLVNVSNNKQKVNVPLESYGINSDTGIKDLVSGQEHKANNKILDITLEPYQVMWVKAAN